MLREKLREKTEIWDCKPNCWKGRTLCRSIGPTSLNYVSVPSESKNPLRRFKLVSSDNVQLFILTYFAIAVVMTTRWRHSSSSSSSSSTAPCQRSCQYSSIYRSVYRHGSAAPRSHLLVAYHAKRLSPKYRLCITVVTALRFVLETKLDPILNLPVFHINLKIGLHRTFYLYSILPE